MMIVKCLSCNNSFPLDRFQKHCEDEHWWWIAINIFGRKIRWHRVAKEIRVLHGEYYERHKL